MKKETIITVEWLKQHGACQSGIAWATDVIGEGLPLSHLFPKIPKISWMFWMIQQTEITKSQLVELSVLVAKSVLFIYEKKYPNDNRPRLAIIATQKYIKNPTPKNRKKVVNALANAADALANAADAAYATERLTADALANAADAVAYAVYAAYATERLTANVVNALANATDAVYATDAADKKLTETIIKKVCNKLKKWGVK